MNIKGNLRKITELGISLTAITLLALTGCGGGGDLGSATAAVVTTFAGISGSFDITDGASSVARFHNPNYFATDGSNLYVTDNFNHNIRKIVIATGEVTTLAGSTAGSTGFGFFDGASAVARFDTPNGIAVDGANNNLYVADTNNNVIRQINLTTGHVSTIAGSLAKLSGASDAAGANAGFNGPTGMTRIGATLYVSDFNSNTIRKIDISNLATASAVVSTLAGTAGPSGYNDGVGSTSGNPTARFNNPTGLTNDGSSLYLTDNGNNDVRKVNPNSGLTTLVAGGNYQSPASGVGSTDGSRDSARFTQPWGLATDGSYLYVADTSNHTIRKILIASGAVTTLAGTAGASGVADGSGSNARFYFPNDVIYIKGVLYVADFGNGSIRKIK